MKNAIVVIAGIIVVGSIIKRTNTWKQLKEAYDIGKLAAKAGDTLPEAIVNGMAEINSKSAVTTAE